MIDGAIGLSFPARPQLVLFDGFCPGTFLAYSGFVHIAVLVGPFRMPTFYFDVRDGPHCLMDTEGQDFPDIGAAEREAVQVATEIGRDANHNVSVDVLNQHGRWMKTVSYDHLEQVNRPKISQQADFRRRDMGTSMIDRARST